MELKKKSLRERTTNPPKPVDSSRIAYKYHERNGVPKIWENHVKEVRTKAEAVKIVENNVIEAPEKDRHRAWVNSILLEIINYHVVKHEVLETLANAGTPVMPGVGVITSPAFRDERLIKELDTFGKLTELDRKGAGLSEYVPFLNNGDAPLALLAKIVDYAVTHCDGEHLDDVISPHGHPVFRMFESKEEAFASLSRESRAGEMVYAPLAELFGHPGLAGDILMHVFKVNHPDIHDYVIETIREPKVKEKLGFTRNIVSNLKKGIGSGLAKFGFAGEVQPRMKKHEGKIMRKIRRRLSEQYAESPESAEIPLNDYISKMLPSYDLTVLNDLIALRVILRDFAGRKIDEMPDNEKQYAINVALDVVRKNLENLNAAVGGHYTYNHEFWDKANGYRSHHFDVRPNNGLSATRFEIQLRTEEWHEISEHGRAAHYYYIGGDSEFVKMVKDSYKDKIHMFRRR